MSKPRIRQNVLHFDYFSANYLQFEKDFYHYSAINLPLPFITDDLLMSMAGAQKSYFILNRHNAYDQREHYYIFKVKVITEPKTVHIYEYIGHKLRL